MAIKEYAGGAAPTTLTASINSAAASCSVADATNWPLGATGDFWIVIDPGLSNEEKIKCDSRTGNTINFAGSGRGGDGTTATSHSSGAVVDHVFVAEDAREANDHVFDVTNDDHTQYLNSIRHANQALHLLGTHVPVSTTVADLTGDKTAGTSTSASAGDHKHEIPAWTAYSPTISGFSVGGGSLVARYLRIGKLLSFRIYFSADGTSTFTGSFQLTLPTGLSAALLDLAMVSVDLDGNALPGNALIVGNLVIPRSTTPTIPELSTLSNTYPSATWGAGDGFQIIGNNIELT